VITSAPVKNSTELIMCHFILCVHQLLVLAAQPILLLVLFPEKKHSLNYLVCHRALIHFNQESSRDAQLLAKSFNFHSRLKRNDCAAGCYVLQFLV